MNKLKIVFGILGLTVIPIIGNLLCLCFFPFLCISLLFSDDRDFCEQIITFENLLARYENSK